MGLSAKWTCLATLVAGWGLLGGCGEGRAPRAPSADAGREDAAAACQPEDPGCVQCPGGAATPLSLEWPFRGVRGEDWVIRNYLDLEALPEETQDYSSATGDLARTYDGHQGLDVGIANFRTMDDGVPLYAATAGTVVRSVDGRFDRNTSIDDCGEGANYVDVRHDSGYLLRYFHFKKDTVAVTEGTRIHTGDYLGDVGSSGCSSWPHLHLELRDCDNRPLETFLTDFWARLEPYTTGARIMDVVIRNRPFAPETFLSEFRDAEPNPATLTAGDAVGIGIILGEGQAGDAIEVTVTDGAGQTFATLRTDLTRSYSRSFWYWNRTLTGAEGTWTASAAVNGTPLSSASWTLRAAR